MALTTLPTAAFATGSVGTSQLADGAVTTEKLVADVNFRNIIINGDMSIAQRGAGPSGAFASGQYIQGPDRYKIDISNMGNWKSSQSTDVPSGQGFNYSLKLDCDAADASPSAGDFIYLNQPIEGFNTASFKFGSSSAESLTLSFWVKSNKTGTYIVRFYDIDNQRALSQSYTISSASTWEKKTITISGDTVSGPNYDNGYAFAINWCLGAGTTYTSGTLNTSWNSLTSADQFVGQVNLADSTSNEWYVTGAQLEVGTSASDFEFLPYDVNLRRCQRYYFVINQSGANGGPLHPGRTNGSADINNIGVACPVPLRIGNPSVTIQSGTIMQVWANTFSMTSAGGGSVTSLVNTGSDSIRLMLNVNGFSGLSNGVAANWGPVISGMPVDAEL